MQSKLQLRWKERPGGGGKTARRFLDIIVDGHSLLEVLGCPQSDFISRLGLGADVVQEASIDHLLLKLPPDSPSKRVLLFVCPECGDLGCGAFSVRIAKSGEDYVWSDFAFENNYDDEPTELFPDAGPFHFEKNDYYAALTRVY